MNSPLSDIKRGVLEYLLGVNRANRIRDTFPYLTPLCEWGKKVRRCKDKSAVRWRFGSDHHWRYSCKRHAFDPDYDDVLGELITHPGQIEWEWLGEEEEIPDYPIPEGFKV